MKPIHYLGLVVRLFAIWLFISGVAEVVSFFEMKSAGKASSMPSFIVMLITLIPIIASVYLWFFPLTVAQKLLGQEEKEFEPVNPKSLLTIFVASIGLFFLFRSFIDGVFWLSFYAGYLSGGSHMMTSAEVAFFNAIAASDKAAIISTIVELVIALLLVVKCRSIAGLMARIAR